MTRKILRFASLVSFFSYFLAAAAAQPGVCPVVPAGTNLTADAVSPSAGPPFDESKENDVQHETLNVPKYQTRRPIVTGDYVVIEYNASQDPKVQFHGLTSWSDYHRAFENRGLSNQAHIIVPNGSFLPVIYAKEKIAVRVCRLHFTDVLTVTTSPNGVPEGGADVRGVAPVTPAASLSSTLDMLQSGSATGGTTTQPGLGLSAPAQLPSLTISGITPGTLSEDQTPGKPPVYTPATVTASGKQVALLLFSLQKNAVEISRLIDRTMGQPYDEAEGNSEGIRSSEFKSLFDRALKQTQPGNHSTEDENLTATQRARQEEGREARSAPGSVNGVNYIVGVILKEVKTDDGDPANGVAFDQHLTDIQNINAQISTLASTLTSQSFASNGLTLLGNYSTLSGVLDLATLALKQTNCQRNQSTIQPANPSAIDLSKLGIGDFLNWTPSQIVALSAGQIKTISDQPDPLDPTGQKKPVRKFVTDLQNALRGLGIPNGTPSTGDQPLCSVFEKHKADDFWESYGNALPALGLMQPDAPDRPCVRLGDAAFKDLYVNYALGHPIPMSKECFEGFVGDTLKVLLANLDALRGKLGEIDRNTTELYDRMNEWYFRSSVEQTDLLPPLTSNAFVRISIVVQRGYTPFTLANAGGTFTATATTNVPATSSSASTSTPAHSVKTILVEVHRLANFNLEGGAMFIHIPTASYAVQASPTPATPASASGTYTATCGSTTGTVSTQGYGCVVQTQQTQWQLAAMAGLVWFPWGHDYFPRHNGFANYGKNLWPSVLIATSVSTLGNSMVGVNWEPVSGIDFTAGLGSAHRTVLPNGFTVNTPVASGTSLSTVTQEHAGFTFGFGIDLSVFTQIFGAKTSAAAQP